MLLSLSTGSIYKWGNNLDELLEICKKIKLDGVEIMLVNKEALEKFNINQTNLEWVKTLQHVTLHVPVKLVANSTDVQDIENQLALLNKIYTLVRAKAIIFHITNLPDVNLLNKFDFKFIIENTPTKGNINLSEFAETIEKYKSDVCLDVSHSFTWSKTETESYLSKLQNKIFQIHLSASTGEHEHLPMATMNQNFAESINCLKDTTIPFVIESEYNDMDLEFLKKDLDFIYKTLNSQAHA